MLLRCCLVVVYIAVCLAVVVAFLVRVLDQAAERDRNDQNCRRGDESLKSLDAHGGAAVPNHVRPVSVFEHHLVLDVMSEAGALVVSRALSKLAAPLCTNRLHTLASFVSIGTGFLGRISGTASVVAAIDASSAMAQKQTVSRFDAFPVRIPISGIAFAVEDNFSALGRLGRIARFRRICYVFCNVGRSGSSGDSFVVTLVVNVANVNRRNIGRVRLRTFSCRSNSHSRIVHIDLVVINRINLE